MKAGTAAEYRFWSKVQINGSDECWPWQASCFPAGYGQFKVDGTMKMAHRCSYELKHGPIPVDRMVLHRCTNKKCVNPKHLFLGTFQESMDNRKRRGLNQLFSGERHGSAKVSVEIIHQMRDLYAQGGKTKTEVGAIFGVKKTQAWRILTNNQWKDIK